LVRDHGDVLEADMQREYGIELGDLYRRRLTLRRLRVLVDQLPFDSRTARAVGEVDEALAVWSLDSALLGRLVDELAALRWEYEAVHVDKRHQREAPTSVLPSNAEKREEDAPLMKPSELVHWMRDVRGDDGGD
jgi:hypothetical protein